MTKTTRETLSKNLKNTRCFRNITTWKQFVVVRNLAVFGGTKTTHINLRVEWDTITSGTSNQDIWLDIEQTKELRDILNGVLERYEKRKKSEGENGR